MSAPPKLDELVGLEWTIARLAADMRVFGFGSVREVPTVRGAGTVGTLALHVQCPWRLIGGQGIITGHSDLYYWGGSGKEPEDWSYEEGHSLQHRRLDEVLGPHHLPGKAFYYRSGLYVEAVSSAEATGDLALALTGDINLQILPCSADREQWRLLTPGVERDHLVWPAED